MRYANNCTDLQLNNTAIALGKFDGIHLGHMLLIEQVLKLQERGLTGVVFTFEMKPNTIFDVSQMESIYTRQEKRQMLEATGVDCMIEYPFDDVFAGMEAEQFIQKILVDKLDAKYIIVGSDYRFGHNRIGNVDMLKYYGERLGFCVITFEKKKYENIVVSSTCIRSYIREGKMKEAANLLNRYYSITGVVTEGKRLGRTIDVPTANLLPERGKLYPPAGVYASRTILPNMDVVYGITNIGSNPTVNADRHTTVETHLFDFHKDIYGQEIRVELLEYLRPEKKFESLHALKQQIQTDIAIVKKNYLT